MQAAKDGKPVQLDQELVTITRGGKQVVKVRLESAAATGAGFGAPWRGWPNDAPPPAIAPFDAQQAKAHQEAWARHLGVDVEISNSLGMKFRLIPPGEFLMGTAPEDLAELTTLAKLGAARRTELVLLDQEGVQHIVRLTEPYYLGAFEVTRSHFSKFVEADGYRTELERSGKGGFAFHQGNWIRRPEHSWRTPGAWEAREDEPVVHVTWNDAKAFCDWLSRTEGCTYSLPTEAQWEFACRAGAAGLYGAADSANLHEHAWTGELTALADYHPQPVGLRKANPFGLCDILGNVWEYCSDWYSRGPLKPDLRVDPAGPRYGLARVVRGGSWYRSGQLYARCSSRFTGVTVENSDSGLGFRVAIIGELKAKPTPVGPTTTTPPRSQGEKDAFVVLGGNGVAERKFDTLAEAVLEASDGDTIEIRGNGPFVSQPIRIAGPSLLIRAGQGFRPVIKFDPQSDELLGVLLLSDAPLVLEGLEIQDDGREKHAVAYLR